MSWAGDHPEAAVVLASLVVLLVALGVTLRVSHRQTALQAPSYLQPGPGRDQPDEKADLSCGDGLRET
jgi:hypothetical protein